MSSDWLPKSKEQKLREKMSFVLIGVIFAGIFAYQYLFLKTEPKEEVSTQNPIPKEAPLTQSQEVKSEPLINQKFEKDANTVRSTLDKTKDLLFLENQYLKLGFLKSNGGLVDIVLPNYKDFSGKTSQMNAHFNFEAGDRIPLDLRLSKLGDINYQTVSLSEGKLIFKGRKAGVTFEKIVALDEKIPYQLNIQMNISNSGSFLEDSVNLFWGDGVGPFIEDASLLTSYDQQSKISFLNESSLEEEFLEGSQVDAKKNLKWVSVDNRFFVVAMVPQKAGIYEISYDKGILFREKILLKDPIRLKSGNQIQKQYSLYLGPKNSTYLESFGNHLGVINERGWFIFPLIAKYLKYLIFWLDQLFLNYGVSIIFAAFLLKLVFFPLNRRSSLAMEKMSKLHPQLEALKQKYANDKVALNQKMMELYKKENISMTAGCLPLLIQLPFFIAFYKAIPEMPELVQSHFLWIQDLSSPDTIFFIAPFKNSLFLPYRFNLMPILMASATFIQTRLNTSGNINPQAQMMNKFVPFMLLFFLWNAPSGLTIYWTSQTLFSILFQLFKKKNQIIEWIIKKR